MELAQQSDTFYGMGDKDTQELARNKFKFAFTLAHAGGMGLMQARLVCCFPKTLLETKSLNGHSGLHALKQLPFGLE